MVGSDQITLRMIFTDMNEVRSIRNGNATNAMYAHPSFAEDTWDKYLKKRKSK